jgi:hypothetical protein
MTEIDSIEEYLQYVGRFRQSSYGKQFRSQFRDSRGTAELAMLAAPTEKEYEDFERAVAVMTAQQKQCPEKLTDEHIADIAQWSNADRGNVSIFINGYVLARKKARASK